MAGPNLSTAVITVNGETRSLAEWFEMIYSSGCSASATFTPAATTYGDNTIMDATKQFSFVDRNGVAVPSGSVIQILESLIVIPIAAIPIGQTAYTLQSYKVTPPSAQADQATWTGNVSDADAYINPILLGVPVNRGGFLSVRAQYVGLTFALTGSSIFSRLVTDRGHLAAAVGRAVTLFGAVL